MSTSSSNEKCGNFVIEISPVSQPLRRPPRAFFVDDFRYAFPVLLLIFPSRSPFKKTCKDGLLYLFKIEVSVLCNVTPCILY